MEGYTNICEATSQSHELDSFRPTHRKGKKLLAEKKRRARINNCLMQIRDIVCHGEEAKDNDIDKMEKAEILEKTLEVLTNLRNDHGGTRNSMSSHKAMAVRYASGFSSCAEESIRYIQCSRLVPTEVKHQLQAHLRSIARRMESNLSDAPALSYDLSYSSPPVAMSTPVSSLPTIHPQEPTRSSSSSHFLPVSSNISVKTSPRVSPITRLDFQNTSQSCAGPTMNTTESNSSEGRVKIPSPIHSSTPALRVDDRDIVAFPHNIPHGYGNSQSNFSPITAHDFAQEHKENHPSDTSYICMPSSYSQERRIFSSQGNSAFHKFSPHSVSGTPSSSSLKGQQEMLYYSELPTSSSLPTSLPTVSSDISKPSHSQYSPISPATSPAPTVCSVPLALSPSVSMSSVPKHQIYQYHGYEPYPVFPVTSSASSSCATIILSETSAQSSSLTSSQSTAITTSSSALDLCMKRTESHNISPETMWRPW